MDNNYTLLLLLLAPTLGAILLAFFGPQQPRRVALWALAISLLALALTACTLTQFLLDGIDGEFKLQFKTTLIPGLAANFHLGVDGISLWLVLLTNLLSAISILASFTAINKQPRSYYTLMLLLQAGMTGVFISMDLLLFFVFFEITLVPLFLLVGIWGGPQRRLAAFKLYIYTVAGGALTLGAIVLIGWLYQNQNDGIWTFEITRLYTLASAIPANLQLLLFIALFIGFAVKVPVFPFHTWLPIAHTEAPTAGSVLLAGVLLKLGTYGFLRVALPILPEISFHAAPFVAVLAIIGIIYTSLCAWVQTDIKKLVAYSSVAHLGFCMLGMFAFNHTGLSAALLYMINHGLSTGALFLVVGMIYERYHTRQFSQLGGLAYRMPIFAFFLILFSLSSIGLPGLNGFISEFGVLYAVFTSSSELHLMVGPLGKPYAIIAATGIILSAVYMLWMCQRVLFGPLKEPQLHHDNAEHTLPVDLSTREWALLTPIAILVVLLGVYPKIYFDSTRPSLEKIDQQIVNVMQNPANDSDNNQVVTDQPPNTSEIENSITDVQYQTDAADNTLNKPEELDQDYKY